MSKNFWKESEDKILVEYYGKISEKQLITLLPERSGPSIRMRTELLGIRKKQKITFFNENFFEIPNILNSYWAGFLAADGYVVNNCNKLGVILAIKDKEHILKFARDIDYRGRFVSRFRAFTTTPKRLKEQFGIQINGAKKLILDLYTNYNITQNKSKTLLPPNLQNDQLIDAFIVGYIDGDGSINEGKKSVSIRGTQEILTWIRNRFASIIPTKTNPRINSGIYIINFTNNTAIRLINYYKNIDVPKLERKWGK